jgi:hypothetical protein
MPARDGVEVLGLVNPMSTSPFTAALLRERFSVSYVGTKKPLGGIPSLGESSYRSVCPLRTACRRARQTEWNFGRARASSLRSRTVTSGLRRGNADPNRWLDLAGIDPRTNGFPTPPVTAGPIRPWTASRRTDLSKRMLDGLIRLQ